MATDRVSFPTVVAGRCEEGTRIGAKCIYVVIDGPVTIAAVAALVAATAVVACTHNNIRVHSINACCRRDIDIVDAVAGYAAAR